MVERIMELDEEVAISHETKMQLGAALSHHVVSKDIAHIDSLRQEETMERILNLAKTREGLAALIELNNK